MASVRNIVRDYPAELQVLHGFSQTKILLTPEARLDTTTKEVYEMCMEHLMFPC
jgi:hypothetical protein